MIFRSFPAAMLLQALAGLSLAQDPVVDRWRYTLKTPEEGWQTVEAVSLWST